MNQQLVLSLFPGADLFGRAFESLGFCVVRGPDVLWGGDIRDFHVPPGRFDGIIGGPPCQFASNAAIGGTRAINLIPEFLRIVEEAKPKWAVMENVRGVIRRKAGPDWPYTILRDWDCGGLTHRTRAFWFYNIPPAIEPLAREGTPELSVLATSWMHRGTSKMYRKSEKKLPTMHNNLPASEAARLQGFDDLADKIMMAQPAARPNSHSGLTAASRRILAVHMLGNGVPRAMGEYIARHVLEQVTNERQSDCNDLPPYPLFKSEPLEPKP